jgi:hypothetical protein
MSCITDADRSSPADRSVGPSGRTSRSCPCQVELVLECGEDLHIPCSGLVDRALQERPRAAAPVLTVVADLIAEHARDSAVQPGQSGVGGDIRHDTQLTDGFHALDRHQVLEQIHGVLRPREADPLEDLALQAGSVYRLAADNPRGIAVEEPN